MLKRYLKSLPTKAERKTALKQFQLKVPQNDEWLHDWVDLYMGVYIPRKKICRDHVSPFTAFANAFFARDRIAVWKASRGFGAKTFNLSLLGLVELILLRANIRLLGGSFDQSQNINDYMRGANPRTKGTFWEAPLAPRQLLEDKSTETTKTEFKIGRGGYVKALTASQRSVRGQHPDRLRLDEIDEMEQEIFDASMGQTMSTAEVPAQTVASSTHQHADGPMTEAIRRARESGWGYYEWCYRENMEPHGWLPESEVEAKKQEVPKPMWDAEYEGQEPNPEDRIFSAETLNVLFNEGLGEFEGRPYEVVKILEPGTGRFYHGADWGKTRDWSVFTTFRESLQGPDIMARWERRGREEWPDMIGRFNEIASLFGGAACHDVTGIGSVIDDYLTIPSYGVNFARIAERDEMLNRYISAAEHGNIAGPMVRFAFEEHKYLTREQVFGRKHLPDSVASAALSSWAKNSAGRGQLMIARL